MPDKIYKHLCLFFVSRNRFCGGSGGRQPQERGVPEYKHLCLDIINAFLSPNCRWRSVFSESNSCHRNLDKLQQGGASRLFGDSSIESEGIKRPYVLGLMWHLLVSHFSGHGILLTGLTLKSQNTNVIEIHGACERILSVS